MVDVKSLLEAVQPYLLGPNDTVDPTDRECYRLTEDDKRQIEWSIAQNGYDSIQNITKGGVVLYLRKHQRFSGEDSAYLRYLFSPESVDRLKWSGPERIIITSDSSEKIGPSGHVIHVVRSYSPFLDRLYNLPYEPETDFRGITIGFRFCATIQARNSLSVLEQHGRIECVAVDRLPKIISEPWQGIWVPFARLNYMFPMGTTASDIGQIPGDGGDYLRFLLMIKSIGATPIAYREKLKMLDGIHLMWGSDGHSFSEYSSNGHLDLEEIMRTEIVDEE